MAAPWEKYQQAAGPWAKYAQPKTDPVVPIDLEQLKDQLFDLSRSAPRDSRARRSNEPGPEGRVPLSRSEQRAADNVKIGDQYHKPGLAENISRTMTGGLQDLTNAGTLALLSQAPRLVGEDPGFTIGQAFDAARRNEGAKAQAVHQEHPIADTVLSIPAAVTSPLTRLAFGGPGTTSVARAAVGGAGTGALYAGTTAEPGQELEQAKSGALWGGALGAGGQWGGNALTAAAPRLAARAAASPARQLAEEGVALTPGMRMGGPAQVIENVLQRAPILGQAIRGARQGAMSDVNVAMANRALAPIGETLPKGIKPGNEAAEFVSQRIGQVYDKAADLAPLIEADEPFMQGMAAIRSNVSELTPDMKAIFQQVMSNRVFPRMSGPLDGRTIRQMQSEIRDIADGYRSSSDGAQRLLAQNLDDVHGTLGNLLARSSPEADALIQQANQGWRNYVVMRGATANSTLRGGIATPSQIATASRMADRSVGKGATARGQATMQDLAKNAGAVVSDTFGNPGTADAIGWGALGTTALHSPVAGGATALGLGAGAAAYSRPALQAFNAIANAAEPGEVAALLGQLSEAVARDPELAVDLQRLLSAPATGH